MANSTQVITDMKSVITNGPSNATLSNCIAPSGAIMDYAGNCKLLLYKMQEISVLIAKVYNQTDPGSDSTNQALLSKIQNDFV
jgi:hypothetical protein